MGMFTTPLESVNFLDRAMTGSPCHQQTHLFTRRLTPAFSARCTRLARTPPPLIRTCSLASLPPRFVYHRVAPLRTHSHTSLRAMRRTVSPRMDLTHPNSSVLCCTMCFHVPAVLQCVQTTPAQGFFTHAPMSTLTYHCCHGQCTDSRLVPFLNIYACDRVASPDQSVRTLCDVHSIRRTQA